MLILTHHAHLSRRCQMSSWPARSREVACAEFDLDPSQKNHRLRKVHNIRLCPAKLRTAVHVYAELFGTLIHRKAHECIYSPSNKISIYMLEISHPPPSSLLSTKPKPKPKPRKCKMQGCQAKGQTQCRPQFGLR